MKLVGNILTVLILLMSAFFFAVAIMTVSTHRNWKPQQLAQLESQLSAQQVEVDDLSKLLNEETIISKERLARMEQAEARAAQLDRQNKGLTERNVELNKEVATSY